MSGKTEKNKGSFWDHLEELRGVLIRSFVLIAIATAFSFFLTPQIFSFLAKSANLKGGQFVLLSPLEGMTTTLKASFFMGLFISSPFWMAFLLFFAAPALRDKEKSVLFPFLITSLAMLFSGVFFSVKITLPIANAFFLEFNKTLGENLWSLSYYFDYTLFLCLAGGVTFEIFAILLFMVHFKVIKEEQMREKRRGAIIASFVIAAILTPPDVLTQLLVALPLILFYEGAILYARLKRIKGSAPSRRPR